MLRLYITGMSRRSAEAVATVRRMCDERLGDRYELDVIDLYRSPARAREDQIIATPTLVRHEPEPCKRLIGGLDDIQRIIDGLILAT
jgi:circadian clock protein KaiB